LLGDACFIEHGLGIEHFLLRWFKYCIEPAQDAHWQDNIAVLATNEEITKDIVCDAPDEGNDFVMRGLIHNVLDAFSMLSVLSTVGGDLLTARKINQCYGKKRSEMMEIWVVNRSQLSEKQAISQSTSEIKKIALISHDFTVADSSGFYDYSEHFERINKLCDDHGCDTILYALYTWDFGSHAVKTHSTIFKNQSHILRVILEVGQPPVSADHVEIWVRGQMEPIKVYQRFATSTSSKSDKHRFLDDLPTRAIGTALLVICGETNIVSLVRGSDDIHDPYRFADRLRDLRIRLILNPIHDFMRRYEMREKRRIYSQDGRTVVSVWNQGRGRESQLPWTVFHDGEERTDCVQDLLEPFAERPDIRVGILKLSGL